MKKTETLPRLFPVALVFASLAFAGCHSGPKPPKSWMREPDAQTEPTPFRVVSGEVDSHPLFMSGNIAVFSPQLSAQEIKNGEVVLRFTVTADGRAISPHVVHSSQSKLADAVIQGMPTWRFKPAMLKGRPVESVVENRFKF